MKIYADTNFFTNYYLDFPLRAEAEALVMTHRAHSAQSLPASFLLRIELTNAFQQAVFLSRHGAQKLRISPEQAMLAEAWFEDDLAQGNFAAVAVLDEATVEAQTRTLIHHHSAREGFRAYDILHVSSALVLGCDTFWSFDVKARKLAQLAGLAVNSVSMPH